MVGKGRVGEGKREKRREEKRVRCEARREAKNALDPVPEPQKTDHIPLQCPFSFPN